MKDAKKFSKLIEFMASQHLAVQHSVGKRHFATSLDMADNAYARKMHYPCVCLDMGDMRINNSPEMERQITILFLDHVRDTGSEIQKDNAFDTTGDIAVQFLSMLVKIAELHPEQTFLSRINIDDTTLTRIELEEAGLYGWAVILTHSFSLNSIACEMNFPTNFKQSLDTHFCDL